MFIVKNFEAFMNKFTKYKVVNSLATVDFHQFPRKYKAMDTN